MKAQGVRLFDVFILGPAMIWAGVELQKRRAGLGTFIAVAGAGTILYNARNYERRQRMLKRRTKP